MADTYYSQLIVFVLLILIAWFILTNRKPKYGPDEFHEDSDLISSLLPSNGLKNEKLEEKIEGKKEDENADLPPATGPEAGPSAPAGPAGQETAPAAPVDPILNQPYPGKNSTNKPIDPMEYPRADPYAEYAKNLLGDMKKDKNAVDTARKNMFVEYDLFYGDVPVSFYNYENQLDTNNWWNYDTTHVKNNRYDWKEIMTPMVIYR